MNKMDMEVGKRYIGYGWRNEFGEFCFTPQQTGANKGRIIKVEEGGNYSISKSKKFYIFNFKIRRTFNLQEVVKEVTRIMDVFITTLIKYEF